MNALAVDLRSVRVRRLVQPFPVLPVSEACALLPMRAEAARRWLVENNLVQRIGGVQVVSWRAVLDTLEGSGAPTPTAQTVKIHGDMPRFEDW